MGFVRDYQNSIIFDLETGSLEANRSPIVSLSYQHGKKFTGLHASVPEGSFISDWVSKFVIEPSLHEKRIPESDVISSFTRALKAAPEAEIDAKSVGGENQCHRQLYFAVGKESYQPVHRLPPDAHAEIAGRSEAVLPPG